MVNLQGVALIRIKINLIGKALTKLILWAVVVSSIIWWSLLSPRKVKAALLQNLTPFIQMRVHHDHQLKLKWTSQEMRHFQILKIVNWIYLLNNHLMWARVGVGYRRKDLASYLILRNENLYKQKILGNNSQWRYCTELNFKKQKLRI